MQLPQLLLGDLDLLQRGGDLLERQEAALLALRDQRPKLVQLVDRRLVRQQHLVLDRSAPLGAGPCKHCTTDDPRRPPSPEIDFVSDSTRNRSRQHRLRMTRPVPSGHAAGRQRLPHRRPGPASGASRQPLARRRHRGREDRPRQAGRRRAAVLRPAASASSTSAATRRARTCRASRRSSTRSIGEVVLGEAAFKAEALAQRIAELVRERQGAARAEVTVAARYPEHKPAPVSGIPTQEIYTLFGSAVASRSGTRRLVGVAAQGMTACPCAQQLVMGDVARAPARRRLHRRRDRADLRPRPRRDAQPARPRHAAHRLPRGRRHGDRGAHAARHRRGLDVVGDLRADEALRRGAPSSRRPTAARASSRTACAR